MNFKLFFHKWTLLITFLWFSFWPSRSTLALTFCFNKFLPTFMIPLRNNHLYWFPLIIRYLLMNFASQIISSSGRWLQPSCTLSAILCPLVFFLFTAPANAYSPLTFVLQAPFDWHFCCWKIAHRKSDDRLAVQRQPMSSSLPLHVVHSELSDNHARSNMATAQKNAGQCYQL